MLFPALLDLFLLPSRFDSALNVELALPSRDFLPVILFFQPSVLINRLADSLIGLSCVALAASLATFVLSARRDIPFRRSLIVAAVCTALAGLLALLATAVGSGPLGRLADATPLVVAALFIVLACVLPFRLPLLISRAGELEAVSAEARKNEARFRAVAENSDDAFMLLDALRDPDGRIEDFLFTYLNANAEAIILKTHSEVVGARITRVLPINPDGKLFDQFRTVVLTGTPWIYEFPLHASDPSGPWMRHQVVKLDDGVAITASDITDRKHADNPEADVERDTLTGLPNRRLLHDRLAQAMARADRYSNKVAVLLLNVDGFEAINGEYGRSSGDEVLRVTAARLRATVRTTDTVIRLDGDEFILVMPDMTMELDVRRTAATLVAIAREPIKIGGRELTIRCSVGVTIYPDSGKSIRDLLSGADEAMCHAKAQGHNRYVLFGSTTGGSNGGGFKSGDDLPRTDDEVYPTKEADWGDPDDDDLRSQQYAD